MQAAVKQKQQQVVGLRTSMMREKEEELALFLEVRKREKERNDSLRQLQELGSSLGSKSTKLPARRVAANDFLNSENDKSDYDWLMTPPGTPLFPSKEMESQKILMSQLGAPMAHPTTLKSRLANPLLEPTTRGNVVSKQPTSSPGLNSSAGARRPSSSGGPVSRSVTPTRHHTSTTASKLSRPLTPTSRATLPSLKATASSVKTSVIATNQTISSTKSSVPSRSSTPISRSTARSSTPTSRPIISAPKSTSRAATPTRRPSTPSSATDISSITVKSSSSVSKPFQTISKNPVPSRGSSPTVRTRPWNPAEMPGFSLDAPPNLRTSLPDRPLSATRGRPGAPSSRSSSVEPTPSGRPRRQSCSPSRGRVLSGSVHLSGSSVPAVNRGYSKVNDHVSPVVIGTKMVERVINMRKLAPPRQDDKLSPHSNFSGKSSSPDSSGFGRTLSKKSLDMAIRHMDIRRSLNGNLRPLMTKIPASSMYSVRSGSIQSRRTMSVSDSPLATSSNASSELSVNNNGLYIDKNLVDDDISSEKGDLSPASVHGR